MQYDARLLALAEATLSPRETDRIIELIEQALGKGGERYSGLDVLGLIKTAGHGTAFNSLALYVNRLARELSLGKSPATRAPVIRGLLHLRERLEAGAVARGWGNDVTAPTKVEVTAYSIETAIVKVYKLSVRREPAPAEIEIWKTHLDNGLPFHVFLLQMMGSPEAKCFPKEGLILPDASDGEFLRAAWEVVLGRGIAVWELNAWLLRLEERTDTRASMLAILFEEALKFIAAKSDTATHDGLSCLIMGTERHLTAAQWAQQAESMSESPPQEQDTRYANRFHIKGEPRILVSALASLYRGGEFIEQFMENITSQDGFDDYCELIIVDADSPENEYETIERYLARHRNITYIRVNHRIGIYDAWNVAAQAARGEYLTNTNLDDLRRHDSFMQQAATLENLSFVDVVYQDLYYTFDPRLSFAEIAAFGHETMLPVITAHNMMKFNSPHNAPMWRKRLHDELGYFDIRYKSAGDYEFWMRCLAAGKKFYKINDPHVAYYQNPQGLSTRPGTRGVDEAMDITRTYSRKLMPEDALIPRDEFLHKLAPGGPIRLQGGSKDRYVLAQQALRNVARSCKYPSRDRDIP